VGAVRLAAVAKEGSTYIVTLTVTDDDGTTPVIPDTGSWSLRDEAGAVVNERTAEALSLGSTMYVVLGADDLAVDATIGNLRYLTVWGTYTSQAHGAGLDFAAEFSIEIDKLVGVP